MFVVQNESNPAAIRHALADLLSGEVDDLKLAAAYVTSGGSDILLDAMRRQLGHQSVNALPKTVVTSFDFGLTEPAALAAWRSLPNCTVRVAGAAALLQGSLTPTAAYHPKLYLFGYARRYTGSLIGSANLTARGLSINTEVAWINERSARTDAEAAFANACVGTVPLTDQLLAHYGELRRRVPPPAAIATEVARVPAPREINPAALQLFRDAVEQGAVDPMAYGQFWVHVEGLQGGSGNQLELPRGAHRFFGFPFANYEYPDKMTIGTPLLTAGARSWDDRLLTWHGNNRMERMNLPTLAQGGFGYDASAVMFRRRDQGFELIVAPWDSDLARSWREASAARGLMYRLGQNTGRAAGFI